MSEDADKSSKTEEPTAKKLADAREQGTVAVSREVNTWMLLIAGGVALVMFLPDIAKDFRFMLLKFIEQLHTIPFDAENMHIGVGVLMDFLGFYRSRSSYLWLSRLGREYYRMV